MVEALQESKTGFIFSFLCNKSWMFLGKPTLNQERVKVPPRLICNLCGISSE